MYKVPQFPEEKAINTSGEYNSLRALIKKLHLR